MMKKTVQLLFVLFAIFLVGGCRGARYDLTKLQLKSEIQGVGRVAIGVQDQRSFIRDGIKPETYIGIHRNGVGIPDDARTRSGKPLAEDVATLLASSFAGNGFEVTRFPLSPSDSLESCLSQIVPSSYDKIIVLSLNNFRSDSWVEVELQWAIRMRVYSGAGELLADKESIGSEEGLKRNYTGAISGGQAQKAISERLRAILVELIKAPECLQAMLN